MRRITASILTICTSISMATPAFAATTLNLPCMQTAIEKRENSFLSSFDSYNTSVRSAMTIRNDALKSAWGITDKTQRKDAIRNAERAFKTSEKTTRKTRRDADKNAEKLYKIEIKLCEVKS
jgi:hypothetical protein